MKQFNQTLPQPPTKKKPLNQVKSVRLNGQSKCYSAKSATKKPWRESPNKANFAL